MKNVIAVQQPGYSHVKAFFSHILLSAADTYSYQVSADRAAAPNFDICTGACSRLCTLCQLESRGAAIDMNVIACTGMPGTPVHLHGGKYDPYSGVHCSTLHVSEALSLIHTIGFSAGNYVMTDCLPKNQTIVVQRSANKCWMAG